MQGVTTAAALWLSGAAGVAWGGGAFDLAVASVLLALIVLWLVSKLAADPSRIAATAGRIVDGSPARALRRSGRRARATAQAKRSAERA